MGLAALILQTAALALAVAFWWGGRHNTLFHNGNWTVGKNSGKFVFYTYEFLMRPLEKGEVDLSRDMGFQEILSARPEGPGRQLDSLSFECRVAYEAYLFVEVRKVGPRLLAARLSRKSGYESGFYQFGAEGDLERFTPLEAEPPWSETAWERVELLRDGGSWRLLMNGRTLGSVPDDLPAAGSFGFRGSGRTSAPVRVRDVTLRLREPASGRTWVERERFSATAGVRRVLPGALAFILGYLLLRRWRRSILGAHLQPAARARLAAADEAGVTAAAALALTWAAFQPTLGVIVPGALLAAEIVFAVSFALGSREENPAGFTPRDRRSLVLFALVLSLLAAAAFSRHGDMIGRGGRGSTWWKIKNIHPDAYLVQPPANRPSPAFTLSQPLQVATANPFFPEGRAYRGQRVALDFVMPSSATFDVVFQQQAFLTFGDTRGEELPLQRRLLRLTTRDDVVGGLATGTHKLPSPFLKINGSAVAGATNHLEIDSDEDAVAVTLNGERTVFDGLKPLGLGETGLLAYEAPVTVSALRIDPAASESVRRYLLPLAGLALPAAAVVVVWVILRCAGAVAVGTVASIVLGALVPLAGYLAAILPVDRNSLLLLTRERLEWLELSLVAAAVFLPVLVLFVRRRIRGAVGFFQAACLVLIAAILLFVVDSISAARPQLLRRFIPDEAVAPGELVDEDPTAGPWYSRNRMIGANNYVWRHRFGTKRVGEKPAGATRVFLMGGSQAWGSGAADSFSTFDQLVERRLRSKGLAVEVFNAGINGAGVGGVRAFYREVVATCAPDILILDIGLNDSANLASTSVKRKPSLRAAQLEAFASLLEVCDAAGVSVLLVQEPMCGESSLRPDPEYYAGLERLARERGVRVLAPQEMLWAAEKSQLVWWDTAHLAPFGHELMSRLLEPAVEQLVRERTAGRAP